LIEIQLVNGEQDECAGQKTEICELADEGVPVPVLQRIIEPVVPVVDLDVDEYERQFQRDDYAKQAATRPAVFGTKIR
jgi:hypothetical protein